MIQSRRCDIYEAGKDELPSWFLNLLMTTKEEVVKQIAIRKEEFLSSIEDSEMYSTAYYSYAKDLFDRFQKNVEYTVFPTKLEPLWHYIFEISPYGIELHLAHISYVYLRKEPRIYTDKTDYDFGQRDEETMQALKRFITETDDTSFLVARVESKLLTADEYAAKYNVETVTVRQWIRRGKIKSAKKYGREWMIPLFSTVSTRNYNLTGYYYIPIDAPDLPNEFPYLRKNAKVDISLDFHDLRSYNVTVTPMGDGDDTETVISAKEREEMEYYLISTNAVKYLGDTKTYRWTKATCNEEDT